ncbi:hypothetical protein NLM27_41155 [Bradyrhizobium sp. CCGB12]|uniref:hypothetical protein n=1 Tax=Bradyrhizobium sp. CCGB12 TaxID=2949632 RepID=UPI0020B457C3|nr:hypothetical protein [Bradyrhizobium sp. CCGB12]MCP3395154.1 hypothetical protein [Bradyrhizobium sp. CCGB12]
MRAIAGVVRIERSPRDPGGLANAIARCDGVVAVQIGATDQARTSVPTIEKGMRNSEGFFAGLLMIEALDEAAVRTAWRNAVEVAPDVVGILDDPEIYQSIFALDARIADIG